jgi:hypothetical protein
MDSSRRTLSRSVVRCVAITGGTHGNEMNGVYLAKHFMANPNIVRQQSVSHSGWSSTEATDAWWMTGGPRLRRKCFCRIPRLSPHRGDS